MKAFLAAVMIAGTLAALPAVAAEPEVSQIAAEPSPSPKPKALPIRNVTVDVQKMDNQAPQDSNTHIEAPPMRMFRAMPAPNAAPGSAANEMAAPAAIQQQKAKPAVSPSASPSPRR